MAFLRGLVGDYKGNILGAIVTAGAALSACGGGGELQLTTSPGVEAAGADRRPRVDSIEVIALDVPSEAAGKAVFVSHPLAVSVSIRVRGEPFQSAVIVGLESSDGLLRCPLGTIDLVHQTNSKADANATYDIPVVGDLFVQPACKALIGKTDAKVWVSIDPFGELDVVGRKLPSVTEATTGLDHAYAARLPLDDCTPAYASKHPASCVTALTVMASPGRDAVLTNVQLGSSVAVIEVEQKPVVKDQTGTPDPETGMPIAPPDAAAFVARVDETPKFFVNASIRIYGGEANEATAMPAGKTALEFSLRPLPGDVPAEWLETDPSLVDFRPLEAEVSQKDKNGETAYVRVKADLVGRLVDAVPHGKQAGVYPAPEVTELFANGPWRNFQRFQLRVCAKAEFAEAGPDDDATANNCSLHDVIVVRKIKVATWGGEDTGAPDPLAAGDGNFQVEASWEKFIGDESTLAVGPVVSSKVTASPDWTKARTKMAVEVRGWVEGDLLGVDWATTDFTTPSTPDTVTVGLGFLGIKLDVTGKAPDNVAVGWTNLMIDGVPLPFQGTAPEVVLEVKRCFPLRIGAVALPINVCVFLTGAVGLDFQLTKGLAQIDEKPGGGSVDCSKGVVLGEICYRTYPTRTDDNGFDTGKAFTTAQAADAFCKDKGGAIAAPWDAATRDAIESSRTKAGATIAYVGGEGFCSIPQAEADLEKAKQDAAAAAAAAQGGGKVAQAATVATKKAVADFEARLATCKAEYKKPESWRAKGLGTGVATLPLSFFATGKPVEHRRVAMGASGKLTDVPETTAGYGVACAFSQSGRNIAMTLSPYAVLSVTAALRFDFFGKQYLGVEIELLRLDLPVVARADYWDIKKGSDNVRQAYATVQAAVKVSSLSGNIFAEGNIAGLSFYWLLYEWEGITLAKHKFLDRKTPLSTITF